MDMNISLQRVALFLLRARSDATTDAARLALAEVEISVLRDMLKRAGIDAYAAAGGKEAHAGGAAAVDVTPMSSDTEVLAAG